jgi:hypothetical protein
MVSCTYLHIQKLNELFYQQMINPIWRGRPGHDHMIIGFTTITTDDVSSNLDQGEVYNIMW